MKDYTNMIQVLKDDGHPVDEADFANKMRNPAFVESVRKALAAIGNTKKDSATFAKDWLNAPETPAQTPVNPPTQTPTKNEEPSLVSKALNTLGDAWNTTSDVLKWNPQEPSTSDFRNGLTKAYNIARSVPAGLLATGYGIGTKAGSIFSDDYDNNALDKADRVYDIAMGAPTEHKILQTGAKIVTDPISMGLATITGGTTLAPSLLKNITSPVAKAVLVNGALQGAGAAGSTYASDPNTTKTDVIASGLVGAGLGSLLGGGTKYIGSKLSQAGKSATEFLDRLNDFDKTKDLSRTLPEIAKKEAEDASKTAINQAMTKAMSDAKDQYTGVGKDAYDVGIKAAFDPDNYENLMTIAQNNGWASAKIVGEEMAKAAQKEAQDRVIVALRRSLTDRAPQFADHISKLNTVDDLVAFSDNLKFGDKFVPDVKLPLSSLGAVLGTVNHGIGGGLLGALGGYVAPKIAQGAVDAVETVSPRIIPRLTQGVASVSDVVAPRVASYVPQAITQEFSSLFPDQDRDIKKRLQPAPQDNTRVQR